MLEAKDFSICIWIDAFTNFVSFGIKSRFKFLARRKAIKKLVDGYRLPYCGIVQADESEIIKITVTEHD